MNDFAIIDGDKRQFYIAAALKAKGYSAKLYNNLDFHDSKYIVTCTPMSKDNKYLNCDFYSSYPMLSFLNLLKSDKILFAGNMSSNFDVICKSKHISFYDYLKDDNLIWKNAVLTAEGVIKEIIEKSDFALISSKVLIIGFGKCGRNISLKLKSFTKDVYVYDHTYEHLIQAQMLGLKKITYDCLDSFINQFNIIINTVPNIVLKNDKLSKLNKDCIIFDISSYPFGFNHYDIENNSLLLYTCPGIPGKTSPKTAGEIIAQSIISYLERTGNNVS